MLGEIAFLQVVQEALHIHDTSKEIEAALRCHAMGEIRENLAQTARHLCSQQRSRRALRLTFEATIATLAGSERLSRQ